jgi:tubulin polyglutamylase TTLL2
LKLYLYKEGLVRFSTDQYDTTKLTNQFSHLTNSSINKYAHGAGQEGARVHDNKWTLEQLKHHFRSSGFEFETVWMKIEKIIILTCIPLCQMCPNYDNCFELMGFDIMVDSQLKPWLLEVNSSPAMSMDGPADQSVKPDLLKDTFKLIDFEPMEVYLRGDNQKNKKPRENPIA